MRCYSRLRRSWEHVGKYNKHISDCDNREINPNKTAFIGLLELLCQVDETVVREQAAKSMANIAG